MKQFLILMILVLSVFTTACGGSAAPPASNSTSVPAPTRAAGSTAAPSIPSSVPAPTDAPPTDAPNAAPTTANTPAATSGSEIPDSPSGAPLDVVKKASLEVFSANTVRASTIIEPANGENSTLTLEYVKPNRIHVIQTNAEGESTERIAIKGTGFWTKNGDTWQAEGADAAEFLFALLNPEALEASFKVIQTDSIQFVGAELLNGRPVFVYTYDTVVDFGTQKSNGTGKLWVGALDGRAYQGESTAESFVIPGSQDHTVVTYEYDIPLTIDPPQ